MSFPFEFELNQVEANIESCVDSVFGALESEFLLMPRGDGFVDFAEFDGAYEALKRATAGFRDLTPLAVARVVLRRPILVGDVLENAIEDVLSQNRISYRKTKRAERLAGFDQVPDFVVPNEHNARVVIEAKLSEDDGTARDKVTRIQHLAELSVSEGGTPRFEVVACIAGRGFGVRREDMKKLILATGGKVFTLQNMGNLVEHTSLSDFRSGHGT